MQTAESQSPLEVAAGFSPAGRAVVKHTKASSPRCNAPGRQRTMARDSDTVYMNKGLRGPWLRRRGGGLLLLNSNRRRGGTRLSEGGLSSHNTRPWARCAGAGVLRRGLLTKGAPACSAWHSWRTSTALRPCHPPLCAWQNAALSYQRAILQTREDAFSKLAAPVPKKKRILSGEKKSR
jgi:hypothetical protein